MSGKDYSHLACPNPDCRRWAKITSPNWHAIGPPGSLYHTAEVSHHVPATTSACS